ncbi:MAG TPA: hypothetical protein VKG62_06720 [Solirubrobacteraceae bacterium]|nr:hypothetical protein [Solirubrobacteraceae bacterium]
MKFRITRHAGYAAPEDALELLSQRLGPRRNQVSFNMVGTEIRARWMDETWDSRTVEERAEIGRLEILEILRGVCERAPGLDMNWFAVSAQS